MSGELRPKVDPEAVRAAAHNLANAVMAVGEAFARLAEAGAHTTAAIARFKAEQAAASSHQIEGAGHDEDR